MFELAGSGELVVAFELFVRFKGALLTELKPLFEVFLLDDTDEGDGAADILEDEEFELLLLLLLLLEDELDDEKLKVFFRKSFSVLVIL